jgi:hypothetical protein
MGRDFSIQFPTFSFDYVLIEEPLDLAALNRAWEAAHKPIELARLAQLHASHLRQLELYRVWRRDNPRPAGNRACLLAGRSR